MKDIALHLRQESKRTDLPLDVIRTLCEAYAEMIRLEEERDQARRMYCTCMESPTRTSGTPARETALLWEWDCFKIEKAL